jgi:hypothetical protein
MNTAACLSQLAKGPLPLVETDPERIAMLQALQRMGHIRAHAEQRAGHAVLVVEALTPLGRKIESCLDGGRPRRLTTAFWAFKVRETGPREPSKLGSPA